MTQTWLVPLDGSETALRPIDWIIAHAADQRETPTIHLLNVQPALPQDIGRFIDAETLRAFHREAGDAALAPALARLTAAGIAAKPHVLVGEAAPAIVQFAADHACDQILIGSHGHTGLVGTLMGSVAMRVVHLSTVPVLLVR